MTEGTESIGEPVSPRPPLDRFFKITERGSSVRREFLAALTTFATMSYVLAVHPMILSAAGMDQAALITVTALAAAIFSLVMGLLANLPIAQAPGMGSNAYFAFGIVLTMGVPWEAALGMVFYCGIAFLILTVTGIREILLRAFPHGLKVSLTVGIGLFIAGVGLKSSGIVVGAPDPVLVTLGSMQNPAVIISFVGLVLMLVLQRYKVPGAIILSIAAMTIVGCFVEVAGAEGAVAPMTQLPASPVAMPAGFGDLFLALDLGYLWSNFSFAFPIVLSLLFIDLFSSLVAMQAICQRGDLVNEDGTMYAPKRALSADALATTGGALLGTSTTNCYIESAAGVEAGGRTGLVGVFICGFFLIALFLNPLILVIPPAATAPALILLGLLMFSVVVQIDFKDTVVGAPAALTIVLMPITTISDGLAIGMIVYVLLALLAGRAKEVSLLSWILGGSFMAYYAFV